MHFTHTPSNTVLLQEQALFTASIEKIRRQCVCIELAVIAERQVHGTLYQSSLGTTTCCYTRCGLGAHTVVAGSQSPQVC